MFIGVAEVQLRIEGSRSLKDKRQVIRSVMTRMRNDYHVAIAEISDQEVWQLATLGISCVSNSASHAQEIIDKVVTAIEHTRLDCEVTEVMTDVMKV